MGGHLYIVSFGYKHQLKTLWKKGKLPTVKNGLYGDLLKEDTVSLEHGDPVSKGGKTIISNLFLASIRKNNERGNSPITDFLTVDMAKKYFSQFVGVIVKKRGKIIFSGDDYILKATETLKKLGLNLN